MIKMNREEWIAYLKGITGEKEVAIDATDASELTTLLEEVVTDASGTPAE
jgi:hypothetical protein